MQMLKPFIQKDCTLSNRIVCSPMCMYSAEADGKATDWHFVHYGARAVGQVGLVMLEATAVESRGRISTKDLGIWNDEQIEGLKRIVQFGHQQGVKMAIQLAHAGRKAMVDEPIISSSPIPFRHEDPIPVEMSHTDIQEVITAFQAAGKRAKEARFDIVELHAAHGYLIHQFLSPLSNQRTDEYGGSFENRIQLLKQIIHAVQKTWGREKPLYVRISATDYHPEGWQLEDSIQLAKQMKTWGVDLVDVSSGGAIPQPPSAVYPGYQVPFADAIKQQAEIATGAVGLITKPEQAEEILGNQRADLVFIGRELLRDPYWVLRAVQKTEQEYHEPRQYLRAFR
ncbi:NADPH dehydrogenase NamA [Hazenella coriacea]|uniref:NADPH2 dehydrogenase n=1 Tax=Hazenella coriacea TaxID=1179467 RepID=A0A4R3L163_9BACL|nr:NADPH dehydrogenase NamA [Hazenella coriacea]TCS93313.1 NADPH2 dehydrogenase [Hazenella coriacea]